MKGDVKVRGTNVPIVSATVSIQKEGEVALNIQSDDEGSYSHQVGAGKYTIAVSTGGVVSQTKVGDMKADVLRHLIL